MPRTEPGSTGVPWEWHFGEGLAVFPDGHRVNGGKLSQGVHHGVENKLFMNGVGRLQQL